MRSLELARRFRSIHGADVTFVSAEGTPCGELAAVEGFSVGQGSRHDVWILDLPPGSQTSSAGFDDRTATTVVAALDYFEYGTPLPDVIVNLFNHGGAPPGPEECLYLEGFRFAIIREAVRVLGREATTEGRRLLVSFGGSDPRGHTLRTLGVVHELAGTWQGVDVVVGPHFSEFARRTIAATSWIVPHSGRSCFEREVSRAQMVVAGGGTTMLELMFLGSPAVIVPQTVEEERFAAAAAQEGAVIALGKDASIEEIRAAVADVAGSSELRESLSRNGTRLVDGLGGERIVEAVMRVLREKRAAAS